MLRKRLLLLFAVIVPLLVLGGCYPYEEFGPAQAPELNSADYLPQTTGNKWIYDYKENDVNGNDDATKSRTDTVVITGTMSVYGKNPSVYKRVNTRGLTDTIFRAVENSKYYEWVPYLDLQATKLNINRWFEFINFKTQNWDIFDTNVTNMSVELMGQPGLFTGKVSFKGVRGTQSKMTVIKSGHPEMVDVYEFIQNVVVEGTFTSTTQINVKGGTAIHIFVGKGVGIINQIYDPLTLSVPPFNNNLIIKGSAKSLLVSYTPAP